MGRFTLANVYILFWQDYKSTVRHKIWTSWGVSCSQALCCNKHGILFENTTVLGSIPFYRARKMREAIKYNREGNNNINNKDESMKRPKTWRPVLGTFKTNQSQKRSAWTWQLPCYIKRNIDSNISLKLFTEDATL